MTTSIAPERRLAIGQQVEEIVARTPVYDIHTHLFDPAFGELCLWGIDELLVYHYLVAETFRQVRLPYEAFWTLEKRRQAELVWETLFLNSSPVSEACRGVLTTLNLLGLEVKQRDLPALRQWFSRWQAPDFLSRCLAVANVEAICMTNSPFDPAERRTWASGFARDERFTAALRIDPLLVSWPETARTLATEGYVESAELGEMTLSGVRRFLDTWTKRIQAQYLMVSLPPAFVFPNDGVDGRLIERVVLPHCRDHGLPFALMLGAKRAVNPALRLAGDGVGQCHLQVVENLCVQFPDNQFLVTVLSRENQHELCVLARKFRNLHVFGCWWFTNIPHLIEDITRMRLELLGLSFTAQHSDARVLDQILYKWQHSRQIISRVLTDKYVDLAATGWETAPAEMQRDARELLGGAFRRFCRR